MVVDASALVAVIFEEAGYEEIGVKLATAEIVLVPVPCVIETVMAITRYDPRDPIASVEDALAVMGADVIACGEPHWRLAAQAFLTYGKGRHPAGLNFGDCMVYAIAKHSGYPLLFKGDDFSKTDVTPA